MKNIVITGAAGALGTAAIAALNTPKNKLVALDAAKTRPASLPEDVQYLGGYDLTDPEAAQKAAKAIQDKFGTVDTLVHIAGAFAWEEIKTGAPATWQRMFDINLMTALNTTQALLPFFKDGGSVVYIGAAAAMPAAHGMGAYAASKSAVRALTESLADELSGQKIRVNAVLPRIIDTPKNRADMPDADYSEWTTPEAISDVIAFLTSSKARCISGASIPVTFAA
ncbi:SDR family NAD(P)-dependent oxidoreductase [Kordiimonas sp.]|uniref:SDR family NAD(P)-dependent oxidoreductase n=1 Tax=Kordiimonas sp. TaxID=1970157 RepID=UPI003A8FB558